MYKKLHLIGVRRHILTLIRYSSSAALIYLYSSVCMSIYNSDITRAKAFKFIDNISEHCPKVKTVLKFP